MILLIEDNESIIKGLTYSLEKNNYKLVSKTNIKDTKEYLKEPREIDLIILDITLNDGDGVSLYKEMIKDLNIPTIFLTADDTEDMIVNCLELGAEDYITKPFSTKELLARIKRILLRNQKTSVIKVKDITYDLDKLIIKKNNTIIELTPLELKLINLLFLNLNKVVNRNTILDKIWEWTGNFVDSHTVTVYFNRIREKLGTDIIKTIKGMGYMIDEE